MMFESHQTKIIYSSYDVLKFGQTNEKIVDDLTGQSIWLMLAFQMGVRGANQCSSSVNLDSGELASFCCLRLFWWPNWRSPCGPIRGHHMELSHWSKLYVQVKCGQLGSNLRRPMSKLGTQPQSHKWKLFMVIVNFNIQFTVSAYGDKELGVNPGWKRGCYWSRVQELDPWEYGASHDHTRAMVSYHDAGRDSAPTPRAID